MQQSTAAVRRKYLFGMLVCACAAYLSFLYLPKVFAADQVKTTDSLVYSSNTSINSTVNAPFTLYIGDNLAGVTNPLKSLYFTLSGVYTGGGSVAFSINSDSATTKTFTLPTVSGPTPFSFLYDDPSNKINPTSAGGYSYTLNIVPSGVTFYNFAAQMSETHRYVPATCPDGASANEKVKTNRFLIATANSSISSATTTGFTLYIGDNLAGVTSPVKSLYFLASGVYTGGGSLAFSVGGVAQSQQSFTLPSVSGPTHFELLYDDPTDTINPTSAGSYNYTFTASPSGVTLYNFGVELVETHRYKPPTCGGMPIKGDLYSAVFETTGTTTGPSYNSMAWEGNLGTSNTGKVRFQLAASDSSAGPWSFIGGATCASSDWFDPGAPDTPYDLQTSPCSAQWNNKRYYRYAVEICSDDCTLAGTYTPQVTDVIVNWSP